LSDQASFGKKYYCAAFLEQMPDFNSLLTVTSDIDVLLALNIGGGMTFPLLVLLILNTYINVEWSKTQLKLVSGYKPTT
jgi:hypothetical protein